jgi:hypothetical protein
MDELTMIEVIGCESGFWACALEGWGGEITAYLLLVAFVLSCLGLVWVIWARGIADDTQRLRPRSVPQLRLVAGPELHDGSWVRLVEAAPGHLRAEIYIDRSWQPLYRNPSRFFDAAARHRQQLRAR